MLSRLIIAATTLYRSSCPIESARGEAALASLELLQQKQVPCILVDGGSSQEFLEKARGFNAIIIAQDSGSTLGAARRQAIRAATTSGHDFIGYSELEKTSLFSELEILSHTLSRPGVDLVIPSRRSLDSYPLFQRRSEERLNRELSLLTGQTFDYAFGPRFWKRELSKYFLSYTGEYGDSWESIFIPVQRALRDGCACVSRAVDFTYPSIQGGLESISAQMKQKRLEQYVQISEACWADAIRMKDSSPVEHYPSSAANAGNPLPSKS